MTTRIRFRDVTKTFQLHRQRPFLTREVLRIVTQRPASVETFTALRDVSFEIAAGESVGVIGRNGAGKSTLLSLIAQTSYPTRGEVEVSGRVGPLLELGAGFHPELTGRENVFLNAMLLGLSRAQIQARFDSIAAYADIGSFLDTPISTYSTGMRARLGFAVVAHIDADIILLDEILGVGDQQFQQRCRATLDGFRSAGKTLVLVSHSASEVASMCDRAIWIENGAVQADGPVDATLERYHEAMSR